VVARTPTREVPPGPPRSPAEPEGAAEGRRRRSSDSERTKRRRFGRPVTAPASAADAPSCARSGVRQVLVNLRTLGSSIGTRISGRRRKVVRHRRRRSPASQTGKKGKWKK